MPDTKADRHKNPPLRFRPPEAERLWLAGYQVRTGKPMNAILTEAVQVLRSSVGDLIWMADECAQMRHEHEENHPCECRCHLGQEAP